MGCVPAGDPELVVLLAEVLHDLVARRTERGRKVTVNGLENAPGSSMVTALTRCPRSGCVHRSMVCSCSVCGVPAAVEPERVVVADSVDDERVFVVEPSDRMAEPGRVELRRMFAPVQEDLPVAVDVPLVQEEHVRGRLVRVVLDEAKRVRRSARAHPSACTRRTDRPSRGWPADPSMLWPTATAGASRPASTPERVAPPGPPPFHTPFRSIVPSGSLGVGPDGGGGSRTSCPSELSGPSTPPGPPPARSCARTMSRKDQRS